MIGTAYERTSVIVTTNLPFEQWTEVLGSERLTGAALDRLTHRCHDPRDGRGELPAAGRQATTTTRPEPRTLIPRDTPAEYIQTCQCLTFTPPALAFHRPLQPQQASRLAFPISPASPTVSTPPSERPANPSRRSWPERRCRVRFAGLRVASHRQHGREPPVAFLNRTRPSARRLRTRRFRIPGSRRINKADHLLRQLGIFDLSTFSAFISPECDRLKLPANTMSSATVTFACM